MVSHDPLIALDAMGGDYAPTAIVNGAVLAARGIGRPSLGAVMPLAGKLAVFLDVGANADCKPVYLLQFAQMAAAYMERVWKVQRPTVALLNIGEEGGKGSALAQEAYG